MRAIIPLVEGEGDQLAVPTLITKILSDMNRWDWYVGSPIKVGSLDKLRKQLSYSLGAATKRNNCAAILVQLDLDDGCPKEEAQKLAKEIQALNLAQPVAIVFAYREYEAWFLASLPSLAGHHGLPADVVYEGEAEAKRGAKEWLGYQMPRRARYREKVHQKQFSSLIDLELAYEKSRSFRRLYHAIEQLLEAADKGERGYVTP